MTLREGLEEYYAVNPGLSVPATIRDAKSASYFHNHDSTHVVFGTHTGELHEGVNDMWTIFAVDIRFRDYAGGFFATDASVEIVKQFNAAGIASNIKSIAALLSGTLRLTPEIRRRAKAMTKKWPWTAPEAYLDRPLDTLRKEFGIAVFQPEALLGLES